MKVSGDGFEEFSQSPGHHGHHQPTGRRALMLLRCRGRPGRGITMDHGVEKNWLQHSHAKMGMGQNPGTPGEHQNSW